MTSVYEGKVTNEEQGVLFRTIAATEELARRECGKYRDELCGDEEECRAAYPIEVEVWQLVAE